MGNNFYVVRNLYIYIYIFKSGYLCNNYDKFEILSNTILMN